MKVKFFFANKVEEIEKLINAFLESKEVKEIKFIEQSIAEYRTVVSIWYN